MWAFGSLLQCPNFSSSAIAVIHMSVRIGRNWPDTCRSVANYERLSYYCAPLAEGHHLVIGFSDLP